VSFVGKNCGCQKPKRRLLLTAMSKTRLNLEKGVELRDAVHAFIRGFGLLTSDQTPCGHPLHLSEAHALLALKARNESKSQAPTQRELGDHLKVDKSNVSRLCRRLEAKGFIKCKPCAQDGRSRRVSLTAKGMRLASQVDAASKARFSALAALLQSDNAKVVKSLGALSEAIAQVTSDDYC
jgi:DNA-binding MarR family transcriptional regulator